MYGRRRPEQKLRALAFFFACCYLCCIMKHFEVSAAVITRKNNNNQTEIFCAQRPGPKPGKELNETNYKWEFPGGKLEQGETASQALAREIREELDTVIDVGNQVMTVEHQYKDFSITMHAFYCTIVSGTLPLKEHLDSAWLTADKLDSKDWAAADVPIMQKVREEIK